MSSRPLVIGHRGASGYRPEHTRAAYELAFEMGADAVEPDIVATADGVLVLRHENEIGGTTDVAQHPEFAHRRTRREVDGEVLDGWFTEDFTWSELTTLRATERVPHLRPGSATYDGWYPILRLSDLFEIAAESSQKLGRPLGVVAEIKHATHFAAADLPLDELFAAAASEFHGPLIVESFEQTVLSQIAARGVPAQYVYLAEASGSAPDLVARDGSAAATYASQLTPGGLAVLSGSVQGVSVSKASIVDAAGAVSSLVHDIHEAGLIAFTWTLRPENAFLSKSFRGPGGKDDFGDWAGEWRTILDAGVDGVFVDHPDLMRELLGDANAG